MSALRDKVFAVKDIESERVTAWDMEFEVRGMTVKARNKMFGNVDDDTDMSHLYPDLIIATCYDPEDGSQVFEAGDRDSIEEKAAAEVDKLAQAAMRVSGLTPDATKDAKKDSTATPTNSTSST